VRAGAERQAAGGAAIDVLVKWNPRAKGAAKVIAAAQANPDLIFSQPRDGKRVAVFSEPLSRKIGDKTYALRRVYRVTERTIDRHGQRLLLPQWSVDGW